jgi:hypothetical protein
MTSEDGAGRDPHHQAPATNTSHTTSSHDATGHSHYIAGLRRRGAVARRLTILPCGCSDPWNHHCHNATRQPTEREVDGYGAAVAHLYGQGLTPAPQLDELRALWRRGGVERRLAQSVAQRWAVST